MQESRRCQICGKREIDPPKREGITRFVGLWAHLSCFRLAQKQGKITIVKGKGAIYND